jgi:2-iminobutanoate/2-iminopropanoate deaminase
VAKEPVGGSTPGGSYSPGIVAEGRFVYVSGQVAARDGQPTGGSVADQTTVAVQNLAAVLAEAGATLADVVRCGVFLADMADFADMDAAYRGSFPAPLPARTTVGVALAPGFKVEIDCVAALPGQDAP